MSELIGQATSVEQYGAVMGTAMSGERPHHKPYEPRPEGSPPDVFITSWAKSGTTLMQQMFHQIRTAHEGGDMDFDDISRVVPWDDTAYMLDFDMTAPQRAAPRGFKSHREYERLPAGQRYVVTLRDPKETYVSFCRFLNGWHFKRDAVPMEDFWPMWSGGGPGGCDYATHLLSWYARRAEPDTLLMNYRWAAKNREAAIRRMAAFIGVELTPAAEALVLDRTSRDFMVEHKDRFDDAMVCAVLEAKCGIAADSDSSKVQAAGSRSDALPASVAEQIDALWAERIAPVTGHADYAALAAEIEGL
ncbi:MAG: sulfotransferase domain-containing protein [Pseudomonadota bacterium]